jgi:hypothetical protein
MKLRPHQYVGIAAVIFFGGMLIWQLTQPKRDPFSVPGAMPLNTKAYDEKVLQEGFGPGAVDPPALAPPPPPSSASTAELISIGSDDAKDDLYCSGLIYAAYSVSKDRETPEAQKQRDRVIVLAERGTGKLIAAGTADASQTGPIADAHSTRAMTDYSNGTPRIPLADCEARADAK